jgi:pimeloyl-ACP methyl ester carboxylesterase
VPAPAAAAANAVVAPRRRGPRRRWIVLGVVLVLVVAVVAVAAFLLRPQELLPEATAALASTPAATYTNEPTGLTFTPTAPASATGLVLYPGAKVPAEAYAPTARAIAERGYLVVVVHMPLNLAILDSGAAERVIAAHPDIERWAVGGHSLGGAMAAQFAADNPGDAGALALCGAYSATDLSTRPLLASSVYGSLDAAAVKIEDPETQALLPPDTAYLRIDGGNHEQCGWYTGQPNDPPATISRQRQQTLTIGAWVELLQELAAAP